MVVAELGKAADSGTGVTLIVLVHGGYVQVYSSFRR